ncbi:MAG: hypothetical protein WC764_03185 [Candidatus Paceibacterota bacterium]|jgi:hypothetical protein
MSWSLKRQLIVLLILFVFLGMFAGLALLLNKPALSCFDNKQNQGEEGVDCGGPCNNFCPNAVNDPIVRWSRVLPVRAQQFDAVAYIENPNPTAGLSKVDYTFRLYDAKNSPIVERKGSTFINPGEKFALYEPNVDVGNAVPVRAFLELKKPSEGYPWRKIRVASDARPNLTIRSKQFDDSTGNSVTASMANESLADGHAIRIVAVLYDSNGNVTGASSTFVDVIKGGAEVPIVFTWPNRFTENPANLELYLHYNQGIVSGN